MSEVKPRMWIGLGIGDKPDSVYDYDPAGLRNDWTTEYCDIKELEDLQKQNRIMKKALRHLDAGYSGMFGNQEISAKDESWIMAPIIVRDALKKIGEVKE